MTSPTTTFGSRATRAAVTLVSPRGAVFLLLAILLIGIFVLLQEGSSFDSILVRIAPDIAPTALAGVALTGIIRRPWLSKSEFDWA